MGYYARSDAIADSFRFHYMEYTCWAARLKNPNNCPVEDIGQCIADLERVSVQLKNGIESLLAAIALDPTKMEQVCDAAANTDREAILNILLSGGAQRRGLQESGLCDESYDQPSNDEEPVCFSPIDVSGLINGQDFAGSAEQYDDKTFIQKVLRFQDDYFIPEYNSVAYGYMIELASNYYWPKDVPLPIRGNPQVTGIVTGQLYDPLTPYTWTTGTTNVYCHNLCFDVPYLIYRCYMGSSICRNERPIPIDKLADISGYYARSEGRPWWSLSKIYCQLSQDWSY